MIQELVVGDVVIHPSHEFVQRSWDPSLQILFEPDITLALLFNGYSKLLRPAFDLVDLEHDFSSLSERITVQRPVFRMLFCGCHEAAVVGALFWPRLSVFLDQLAFWASVLVGLGRAKNRSRTSRQSHSQQYPSCHFSISLRYFAIK